MKTINLRHEGFNVAISIPDELNKDEASTFINLISSVVNVFDKNCITMARHPVVQSNKIQTKHTHKFDSIKSSNEKMIDFLEDYIKYDANKLAEKFNSSVQTIYNMKNRIIKILDSKGIDVNKYKPGVIEKFKRGKRNKHIIHFKDGKVNDVIREYDIANDDIEKREDFKEKYGLTNWKSARNMRKAAGAYLKKIGGQQ